jgi:hypothetical protein
MCDSCNLFSRSTIKKGLRFWRVRSRPMGNYFHCNKIWMVFQRSNICSFFPDASAPTVFCVDCGRSFAAQIRLISHRQVKHKDKTLRQTADRQMEFFIVAGFFNLHLASLWGFWPHSSDTSNCNPLAWSSINRNPVAHQNTQTPLLETTKPSDSCPWRYGGIGLIGRY